MIPGAFYCDREEFETISGPISFNAGRAMTARKNSIHYLAPCPLQQARPPAAGTASSVSTKMSNVYHYQKIQDLLLCMVLAIDL
jgi:hypothetical protein